MTEPKVETVTIRGLRYLVATLREDDIERIAQKVARLIRDEDQARVTRELALEHQRQVPTKVIEEASRAEGGEPFPLELVEGEWRVKP